MPKIEFAAVASDIVGSVRIGGRRPVAGTGMPAPMLTDLGHGIYDHLPRGGDGDVMEAAIRQRLLEVVEACAAAADAQHSADPAVSGGEAIRKLAGIH